MDAHPVVDPDRRLGVGDADVDVQARRSARAGRARASSRRRTGSARRPRPRSPARSRTDGCPRRRPAGRASRASARAVSGGRGARRPPRRPSPATPVWTSKAEPWVSAVTLLWVSAGSRGSNSVDAVGERPGPRVEEHHLLLDSERVGAGLVATRPRRTRRGRPARRRPSLHRLRPPNLRSRIRAPPRRSRETAPARGPRDQQLGVPLDADQEAAARVLDRLDRPVAGPGRRDEVAPEPVDRLVVERVDVGRRRRRSSPPSRLPGSIRTPCGGSSPGVLLAVRHDLRRASSSGRCWTSVPPRTTLSACMPRQIASIGISRCVGARARSPARSGRGRARSGRVSGAARCAVGLGDRGRGRRRGRSRRAGRAAARSLDPRVAGSRPGGRRPPRSRAGR